MAGYYQGIITLGSDSPNPVNLICTGSQNMVLAKYSTAGVLLWAKGFGLGSETPASIALDQSGNIFVEGNFSGTTDLTGATTATGAAFTSAGGSDVFLAKYSNTG